MTSARPASAPSCERFPGVVVAEVLEIEDDSQRGYQSAMSLLSRLPDLGGIYIAGGGRSGLSRR